MERSEMISQLAVGPVKVTFTKKDGTLREMLCTRKPTIIPMDKHPKNLIVEKDETTTIRVFDIDKSEWRSFTVDSVSAFEPVTN